jgi:hypothetical protein
VWNERTTLPRGIASGLRFGGTQREYRAHHGVGVGRVPAREVEAGEQVGEPDPPVKPPRAGLCVLRGQHDATPGPAACKLQQQPSPDAAPW